MKTLTFLSLMVLPMIVASQDVYVQGHTRSDGTYVAPHVRSAPDSSKWNNYGDPAPSSNMQEQQYNQRDYDRDSSLNQYDYDDDNDGTLDDYEY